LRLKILKKLRTASLNSEFTGSYNKKCTGLRFLQNNCNILYSDVVCKCVTFIPTIAQMKLAQLKMLKIFIQRYSNFLKTNLKLNEKIANQMFTKQSQVTIIGKGFQIFNGK